MTRSGAAILTAIASSSCENPTKVEVVEEEARAYQPDGNHQGSPWKEIRCIRAHAVHRTLPTTDKGKRGALWTNRLRARLFVGAADSTTGGCPTAPLHIHPRYIDRSSSPWLSSTHFLLFLSSATVLVPSIPRGGGTVNSSIADAICTLAIRLLSSTSHASNTLSWHRRGQTHTRPFAFSNLQPPLRPIALLALQTVW